MTIQLTAALSFIIALTVVWRGNKDVDTDDSLILTILIAGLNMLLTFVIALIICLGVVYTFSTTHATKESPDFNRERNW